MQFAYFIQINLKLEELYHLVKIMRMKQQKLHALLED
jgi:hypothetical protein